MIREDVGIWGHIKVSDYLVRVLAILLLELSHVDSQPVLPRDLRGHREMINLLVFLQIFEELVLIMLIVNVPEPAHRVYIRLGLLKIVMLEGQFDQFGVALHHAEVERALIRHVLRRAVVGVKVLLDRPPRDYARGLALQSVQEGLVLGHRVPPGGPPSRQATRKIHPLRGLLEQVERPFPL